MFYEKNTLTKDSAIFNIKIITTNKLKLNKLFSFIINYLVVDFKVCQII